MSAGGSGALSTLASKRVQKELLRFSEGDGTCELALEVVSPSCWQIAFVGPAGSIYAGESFKLKVEFTSDYPMDSPIVVFMQGGVPVHEHVYSNGHICLNILGEDWSPALTVKSVVLSIVSMLSSATKKERPRDDARYSATHGGSSNPKNTRFAYHDDAV